MVKHELSITSEERPEKEEALLCVECNEKYFTLVLTSSSSGKIFYLKYFPIKENLAIPLEELIAISIDKDEYLSDYHNNVKVIYNFPESCLVPASDFKMPLNQAYIRLNYGDTSKGLVLNEKIPGNELFNVYRIPGDLHSGLQQSYKGGKYWHIYSLMIASYEPVEEENHFQVLFYADKMLVMVHKENALQLINAYQYQTPEDVAYYLLSLCRLFEIEPENARIHVSGLIDTESAIAAELLKYLRNVYFGTGSPQILQETEHDQEAVPDHYFSYLVKLALCV